MTDEEALRINAEGLPPLFDAAIRDLDPEGEPRSMVCLWTTDQDPTGALGFIENVRPEDRAAMAGRLQEWAIALSRTGTLTARTRPIR